MTPRLLICIPIHNRLAIAKECIPTVAEGADGAEDTLTLWNDGSTPEVTTELIAWWDKFPREPQDHFITTTAPLGIEEQRRRHFLHFAKDCDQFGWTHLYLTDSDALHDPSWRDRLLAISAKGLPACGYNTEAHARIPGNTIHTDTDIILRRVAPGISYLLTKEMVLKVVKELPRLPPHWFWDWATPAILGHRFGIAAESVVDHIGLGGMHHPPSAGLDGGDVALNPTSWLVAKRREVVAKLSSTP